MRSSQSTSPVTPDAVGTKQATAQRNKERLNQLHPVLAIRARCMLDLCAQAEIPILVMQGFRTWEQQDQLYAKGRTIPPLGKQHIVSYAKGGQSYHNFGLALDVVLLDSAGKANWDTEHPSWKRVRDIGKSVGLAWGGDWRTLKDLAHFENTCDLIQREE